MGVMNALLAERGVRLSEHDFRELSSLVERECGIRMPPIKRTMLESRLQKRVSVLDLSWSEYCRYLFSDDGRANELVHFIDAVTTNKTGFFREPGHFSCLENQALPELFRRRKGSPLRFWSAGCATGEEPYTIAMLAAEFAEQHAGGDFSVLATDICTRTLEKARLGVYPASAVEPVPQHLKEKYLLRSRNPEEGLVRIVPELRQRISFKRLNFMDDSYRLPFRMDVVFCRNVLIYFKRDVQEQVINRICSHLSDGGYLFVGHSETLNGMSLPLAPVLPTIYRKQQAKGQTR